jgi:hypothetical protein
MKVRCPDCRQEKAMRLGSLGASVAAWAGAVLSSLCCLLPLAVIALGLGSGAFMAVTMVDIAQITRYVRRSGPTVSSDPVPSEGRRCARGVLLRGVRERDFKECFAAPNIPLDPPLRRKV